METQQGPSETKGKYEREPDCLEVLVNTLCGHRGTNYHQHPTKTCVYFSVVKKSVDDLMESPYQEWSRGPTRCPVLIDEDTLKMMEGSPVFYEKKDQVEEIHILPTK